MSATIAISPNTLRACAEFLSLATSYAPIRPPPTIADKSDHTTTSLTQRETTIRHFRRLLETHGLAAKLFARVNAHLGRKGLSLRGWTIVDATIIAAPSSTKNRDGEYDPEMYQTRKGNQWHFGMKTHIGVDDESGLVHSVECTAANASEVTQVHKLLHGQEVTVCGDSGYTGVDQRAELPGVKAVFWVAEKPSRVRALKHR